MTRHIPVADRVTHEQLVARLAYDAATGVFTHRRSSGRKRAGEIAGSIQDRYLAIGVHNQVYLAHHLAWFYAHGEWPPDGLEIDHKDRNGCNNALANLRLATGSQNKANRKVMGNSLTGVKGIQINRHGRYRVRIRINGVKKSFGSYETPEEASAVYKREAAKHYGAFAC